ncbi:MAG: hypothetical protein HYT22_02060 [Candidatus Niyogibacteria bacterium]|nr:hypothetical protein [Candidatus Niyogibacteria bacterium]
MVRRLLSTLNVEVSGVHQAAFLLAFASIAAKVLALLRDRILASTFGAGEALDIYFAAFRIPDFLYAASLLLTTSAVVIPFLLRRESESIEAARTFIAQLSAVFWVVMIAAAAGAYMAMPALARLVTPGFSEEATAHLVTLARILLLSPVLLGFSTLVSNVIQAHRRFFVYALSPILYNAGIIIGVLWLYPFWGLPGLAWGVILGAVFHLAIQIPSLIHLGFFPRLLFRIRWQDIASVLKLSLPRSVGLGLNQGVFMVFTAIASALGAGSIAIFQLAYNLYGVPLGVIGLSYSVAAFPGFARSVTEGKHREFAEGVTNVTRYILFWSLPFVVLFIVLRAHIVRVILGAGAFGWADTRLTAASLALFSVAILTQSLVLLFVRAFYAAGHTIFPLIMNGIASAASIAVGWGSVAMLARSPDLRYFIDSSLRVSDIPQTAVLALAFAFSVGSVLNAVLLWFGFSRFFRVPLRTWTRPFIEHGVAAFALGGIAYGVLRSTASWFDLQTFWGVLGHGVFAALIGFVAAFAALWCFNNAELARVSGIFQNRRLTDLRGFLKSAIGRIRKTSVVAPEPRSPSEG